MLNEKESDVLTELINIGVGRGGATLSSMLETPVNLSVPQVQVLADKKALQAALENYDDELIAGVNMGFSGAFEGVSHIIFPKSGAVKLVSALTGESFDSPELDSLRAGALSEIGNIVLNNVMGSLSNMFKKQLNYRVPLYNEGDLDILLSDENRDMDSVILFCKATFAVTGLKIEGDILILFSVHSFDEIKKELNKLLS